MSSRWPLRSLAEVAFVDTETVQPSDHPNEMFNYIGLENIEPHTGRLVGFRPTPGSNIASTKFRFQHHHVLYGKLRPYLCKVLIPRFDGICATDILPLGTREGLLPEFLGYMLRSPRVLGIVTAAMTGTKMPRLRMPELLALEIPVPPVQEQQRIVERLNGLTRQGYGIQEAMEGAEGLTAALGTSVLRDAFASLDCQSVQVADILTEGRYGSSRRADTSGQGIPILRIPNVVRGDIDVSDLKFVPPIDGEISRLRMIPGDILVVRTNGSRNLVGRTAVFRKDEEFIFASYLIRLRVDQSRALPEFVSAFLNSPEGRRQVTTSVRTSAGQYNLNLASIKSFSIPLPDVNRQREVTHCLEAISMRATSISQHRSEGEALLTSALAAALDRAFAGEL